VPHQLLFDVVHQYNTNALDISLPIELRMGQRRFTIPDVKLDTGASFCIFQREYGVVLGLDVESGVQEKVWTATGFFFAYGHEVSLFALGFDFFVTVYFASMPGLPRNVLGRRGWLDQIRLGIIDYDCNLNISKYNE